MNQRTKGTVFFFALLFVAGMAGCRASDCGCPQTDLLDVENGTELVLQS